MTSAPPSIPPGEYVPTADQRLVKYGVPWSHFEVLLALRGDAPVPRMASLEGALELISPSKEHERLKSYVGLLIATYALERDIMLSPYGAWTLLQGPKQVAAEPDECCIVGRDQSKQVPDLAIQVVWTSGGLDKLELYHRLSVFEVWFWKDGKLTVHVLGQHGYEVSPQSCSFQISTSPCCALSSISPLPSTR